MKTKNFLSLPHPLMDYLVNNSNNNISEINKMGGEFVGIQFLKVDAKNFQYVLTAVVPDTFKLKNN